MIDLRDYGRVQGKYAPDVAAVQNLLQTIGQAEQVRQQRQQYELLSELLNKGAAMPQISESMAKFKPSYSQGIPGILQKVAGLTTPPNILGQQVTGAVFDKRLNERPRITPRQKAAEKVEMQKETLRGIGFKENEIKKILKDRELIKAGIQPRARAQTKDKSKLIEEARKLQIAMLIETEKPESERDNDLLNLYQMRLGEIKESLTGSKKQTKSKHQKGDIVTKGGKKYKVVDFDKDGEPLVEPTK